MVLAIACLLGSVADRSMPVMFVAMFALGVGWALALIGGSSLLVESMAADQRVAAQGAADLTTAVSGGAASIVCGFVLGATGFGVLSLASALLIVPVLGAVLRQLGRPAAVLAA